MSANVPRIAVVGSLMTDMISYLPRLPAPGETLLGGAFELGFGGKGANQAVTARRLGCAVTMIGCLGSDIFGDRTNAHLVAEGIDVSALQRTDRAPSGVAPIWVEPDGTNRIVCVPGANAETDPVAAAAAITRIRPHIVLGQFEIPQPVTRAAFAAARVAGAITVLNPAPAADVDPELLARTDWLIPNETELDHLAGTSGAVADDARLRAIAARLPPRLLVTLGAGGAVLVRTDGTCKRMPAPDSAAIDTTGAGDAFIGAFATGLAQGLSPERSIALAVEVAADAVTRRGTQAALRDSAGYAQLLRRPLPPG